MEKKRIDYVEWDVITRYQKLSEHFIEKYKDEFDWDLICTFQKPMSEEFIMKHSDLVNWDIIYREQILSDEFILDLYTQLDSTKISKFQKLSENTIRELNEWLNWLYQNMVIKT